MGKGTPTRTRKGGCTSSTGCTGSLPTRHTHLSHATKVGRPQHKFWGRHSDTAKVQCAGTTQPGDRTPDAKGPCQFHFFAGTSTLLRTIIPKWLDRPRGRSPLGRIRPCNAEFEQCSSHDTTPGAERPRGSPPRIWRYAEYERGSSHGRTSRVERPRGCSPGWAKPATCFYARAGDDAITGSCPSNMVRPDKHALHPTNDKNPGMGRGSLYHECERPYTIYAPGTVPQCQCFKPINRAGWRPNGKAAPPRIAPSATSGSNRPSSKGHLCI